jgi:phosphatidylinositol dimannoside acyltransferase
VKFFLLWILIEVGGHLPARLLYALADLIGALAWRCSSHLRAVTRDHMTRVLAPGALDSAARDRAALGCVRAAARYWADLARASHVPPAIAFDEFESFSGIEHLFAAYDRGCGVVLVTAHVGAPEFAMRAASVLGLDILALTERLQPPRVNALVQRARHRHGEHFVEVGLGGTRDALEQLRRGAIVALIADRDVLGTGLPTMLFGAPAQLPPGPIELALRTGAAVVPCFVLRSDAGIGAGPRCAVRFLPPLDLRRTHDRSGDLHKGLQALARSLETGISMAPDQWFALQPVWRADAPTSRGGAP